MTWSKQGTFKDILNMLEEGGILIAQCEYKNTITGKTFLICLRCGCDPVQISFFINENYSDDILSMFKKLSYDLYKADFLPSVDILSKIKETDIDFPLDDILNEITDF